MAISLNNKEAVREEEQPMRSYRSFPRKMPKPLSRSMNPTFRVPNLKSIRA